MAAPCSSVEGVALLQPTIRSVPSVALARAGLVAARATPHRGPIAVDPQLAICQLRDPFGNMFGLDGPP